MTARTASDWAARLDVSRTAIYHRCKLGYFIKHGAYFTPVDPRALEPSYAERRSSDEGARNELERFREMVAELLPEVPETPPVQEPASEGQIALLKARIAALEDEKESLRARLRAMGARR
jgi:hypothetical protein